MLRIENASFASTEVKIKDLRLRETRGLELTLTTSRTVCGRVVDTGGHPVAGVRLTVGMVFGTDVRGQMAESLEDGSFSVGGLADDFPLTCADNEDPRWWAALS